MLLYRGPVTRAAGTAGVGLLLLFLLLRALSLSLSLSLRGICVEFFCLFRKESELEKEKVEAEVEEDSR